jgi:hypothetical protein
MDFSIGNNSITNIQLWIYNISLIIYFVFLFKKYSRWNIACYLIFLFTVGIASDLGLLFSIGNTVEHIYLVICFIWGISLLSKYGFRSKYCILYSFSAYIFYFFFVSFFKHDDNLPLVISQSLKYIIPIISYFVFESYLKLTNGRSSKLFNLVLKDLILAQIVFCVIKLIVLQAIQEGLVGSLTGRDGGGAGTSFPLLCMIWLAYNTRMKFSNKFFLYVLGFLFIGFMTGKRAIMFLFPLEFAVLYIVYRVKSMPQLMKLILHSFLAMIFFLYIGLKLSPTLNPDNKVWGRFDLEYAYDYAVKYSGGNEDKKGRTTVNEGEGRLGATLLFWNKFIDVSNYDTKILFGVGNEYMRYNTLDTYFDQEYLMGVDYRGGVTGITLMYFISGVVGVLLFLLYFIPILLLINDIKMKLVVIGVVLFDFLFYNAQLIEHTALQAMLLLIVSINSVKNLQRKNIPKVLY